MRGLGETLLNGGALNSRGKKATNQPAIFIFFQFTSTRKRQLWGRLHKNLKLPALICEPEPLSG